MSLVWATQSRVEDLEGGAVTVLHGPCADPEPSCLCPSDTLHPAGPPSPCHKAQGFQLCLDTFQSLHQAEEASAWTKSAEIPMPG